MSLILDALRKMEQDRKVRRSGSVDIRPDILSRRTSPVQKGRGAVVAVALIAAAAGTAGGIFFATRGVTSHESSSSARSVPAPPAAPVLQVQVPSPAAPAPTVPTTAPAAVQASATQSAPVRQVAVEPQKSTLVTASDLRAQPRPANPKGEARVRIEPPADVAVSGIAWQEERPLRRAVVNGALVQEGSEVSGSRVAEIGETFVRFVRGNETFTVTFAPGFVRK